MAERLHWASRRSVTCEEDHSYSLLRLMGVILPVMYGEGLESALYGLQVELYNVTGDQSMFAWMTSSRDSL